MNTENINIYLAHNKGQAKELLVRSDKHFYSGQVVDKGDIIINNHADEEVLSDKILIIAKLRNTTIVY